MIIFAWLFFLETKGLTLEEASLNYDGKDAVRHATAHALREEEAEKGQQADMVHLENDGETSNAQKVKSGV